MDSPSWEDSCDPPGLNRRARRSRQRRQKATAHQSEQHPQQEAGDVPVQVLAREYHKWRRQTDKFVAQSQKETFDMLDQSFRRYFPSRRSGQGADQANLTRARPHDPREERSGNECPPEPSNKRNKRSHLDVEERPSKAHHCRASCVPLHQPPSTPQRPVRDSPSEWIPPVPPSAPQQPSRPSPLAAEGPETGAPLTPSTSELRTVLESSNAEKELERIAPGITKGLKPHEILNLLRAFECLPMWNEKAIAQMRQRQALPQLNSPAATSKAPRAHPAEPAIAQVIEQGHDA